MERTVGQVLFSTNIPWIPKAYEKMRRIFHLDQVSAISIFQPKIRNQAPVLYTSSA